MRALVAAAMLSTSACATVPADGEPPVRHQAQTCKAEPGARFVGRKATPANGAAILAATGAAKLRWLPPRSVITMEFAFGRVNVAYDDALTIVRVTCG